MDRTTERTLGVPQKVLDAVEHYQNNYRHPKLRRLEVSGLYDLRADEPTSVVAQSFWPNPPWPNHDQPGVYLIWDQEMSLRYVGRATTLGVRLHDRFKEGPDGRCVMEDGWKSKPRFVATIPVERTFEAGALEEYLMAGLGDEGPKENATPWYTKWASRADT
jgi:hypothetical protein